MSKYMVDDFDLTNIADKIRESSGIAKDLVFPDEFTNNIKVGYEERASVFEFNITSELTQTLHFTQSEPNAVLIDWGDGSPAESFIGTYTTDVFGYTVNDATHTFRFPGKYLVSFNIKKNRTWIPGTGALGFSFLGYTLIDKSPSNPALISVNIGDGITNILDQIQFNGATGLEYAHFCQKNAQGGVLLSAIQTSTAIKNLILGHNIQTIGGNVFKDCTSIERLELGFQIRSLNGAFSGCTGLKEVYIKSKDAPPKYNSDTFKNVSTKIPFYVQRDLLENYKSIGFYKKFNLQPYDF